MQKPILEKGLYKHYKGNTYEVVDIVLHTESSEWMVLYKANSPQFFDGNKQEVLFVRPYEMFIESVTYQNQLVPRFTQLNS